MTAFRRPDTAPGVTSEQDDNVLVARVVEADSGALKELYDRHAPWLQARLMRRCNDREVVADVLQDTFVALWKDARTSAATGRSRVGCGASRSDGWSPARSRKDVVLMPEWDVPALGRVPAAEDEVLLGVEYGDLAGALRRLSPEFRSVVQAVVLDGLTTKEAGRLLGVRENTVKTRLHRAKAQLRGSLAEAALDEKWR